MKIEIFNELNKIDLIVDFVATMSIHGSEGVRCDLEKTIRHDDDFVLVAKEKDVICGVFSFFVEHQNNYLEMTYAFCNNKAAYDALITYLTHSFKNYQLDVVIKSENPLLEQALKQLGGVFYPVQIKMVLTEFNEYNHSLKVVEYDASYRKQYLALHSTDVYWTGERVLDNLNIFKVFLALSDNSVVGYIDTTYTHQENEPYDFFVREQDRNKGYGKALVNAMVKATYPNNIFVFVDIDNLPAIHVFSSLGFVQTQEKIQTVTIKL